jgi:anti-anti-sigma factor
MSMSDPSPSLIISLTGPARATIAVAGEFDAARVASLISLATAVAQSGVERVVLDLGGVTFLDLAGWRGLAAARRHLEAAGAAVEVRSEAAAARRLEALTALVSGGAPAGTATA